MNLALSSLTWKYVYTWLSDFLKIHTVLKQTEVTKEWNEDNYIQILSHDFNVIIIPGEYISFNFKIYLFIFLVTPHSLWDFSSPNRDWTRALSSKNTES